MKKRSTMPIGMQLFYRDIHKWILAGCPKHKIFSGDKALCRSLEDYLTDMGYEWSAAFAHLRIMVSHFEQDGLNRTYPFNTNRNSAFFDSYYEERYAAAHYKNKNRLQWIVHHDIWVDSFWNRLKKRIAQLIH